MIKKTFFIIIVLVFLVVSNPKNEIKEVVTEDSPIMYLTFDDGPNDFTPAILDILDEYGIKATFFVTGTRPDCFYMIKEASERGHTIGIHAYEHDYGVIYESVENYLLDLERIAQVVQQQTGEPTYYLRFPGGSSNLVSEVNMRDIISVVEKMGYQYYDWNAESGDAKTGCDIASVTASSLSGVDGKKDIMMLCHDREIMIEALPMIIEYYLELGYIFRPIDENTDGFCHLK